MENFEMRRPIIPDDDGFIFLTDDDRGFVAHKYSFPNWGLDQSLSLTDAVNDALLTVGPDNRNKILKEFDRQRVDSPGHALEFLHDVANARRLGLDVGLSMQYATGLANIRVVYSDTGNLDSQVEAPKLEDLLKVYDKAYILGLEFGLDRMNIMDFATSVSVDNNVYNAGKIVADAHNLDPSDSEAFAKVYGPAVNKHGLFEGTIYSLGHMHTAMAASEMKLNIHLNTLDSYAMAILKLVKENPYLSKHISSLTHNALFAARQGLSEDIDESFDFATEILYVRANGLCLNRWKDAVEELRKINLNLNGAIDLATELEEVSNKSGVYILDRTLGYLASQKGRGFTRDQVAENAKLALQNFYTNGQTVRANA